MIIAFAIIAVCWGLFLILSFGPAFYSSLSSNRISLPTLLFVIFGLLFLFVGYKLWKKQKIGGIIGLIVSVLLFLSIVFFVDWGNMAIKFNYLLATVVTPVCILIGWKKLA